MEEDFIYSSDYFLKPPAFTALPYKDHHLTDIEYLRLITRITIKCDIKAETEESDETYRTDFYFLGNTFCGEYVDDWLHILRASDMHTITVIKSNPPTIKVTCFRDKRQEKDSSK